MTLNFSELRNLKYLNTSAKYNFSDFVQKPIEIYMFVDPLCPECWSLEPYIKKLSIEFGRLFSIRPVVSNHLRLVNNETMIKKNKYNQDVWNKNSTFPSIALAIKAAELQGNKAGRKFLRKVQENFFLKKKNISDLDILIRCAEDANLDVSEFKNDLYSVSAKNAFQSDLKITEEMKVEATPTIVFFNLAEDQGIKICGINTYDIYVFILKKMLQKDPVPEKKPPLEDFLDIYGVVSNKEISFVYDWSLAETKRVMKKLQLKQKVKRTLINNDSFWKYKKSI